MIEIPIYSNQARVLYVYKDVVFEIVERLLPNGFIGTNAKLVHPSCLTRNWEYMGVKRFGKPSLEAIYSLYVTHFMQLKGPEENSRSI